MLLHCVWTVSREYKRTVASDALSASVLLHQLMELSIDIDNNVIPSWRHVDDVAGRWHRLFR